MAEQRTQGNVPERSQGGQAGQSGQQHQAQQSQRGQQGQQHQQGQQPGQPAQQQGQQQGQSGQLGQLPQQLTEAGRQLQNDARQLARHASEARGELQTFIADTARQRPIGTLAVAAGIGYVLGGGLSSRLTLLMLGVGTRFAMALAAREMGNWAAQAGSGIGEPSPTRH